ncbi:MAG TPA: EAL domain-containing protein [Pyrinomonadaceae bacterium]|nr:EAL domain-containing protein [Pyrinomonadaceae bacterium]
MIGNRRTLLDWYTYGLIAAGTCCVVLAAYYLPSTAIDINLGILAALTIGLGSRVTIPIPRLSSHISVSDTFIFLTLLLYGGEAAVILAAVEAFVSARRFCSKQINVLFNAAAMAVSISAVTMVLRGYGLYSEDKLHGHQGHVADFILAMSAIVVTQFLFNTFAVAIHDAIRERQPVFETWRTKYSWSFLTYLAGAAGAGALVRLVDMAGFAVMFAAVPIIFFIFYTYRMHLKNVELSIEQAKKAHEYANALKERSVALRESEERFRSAFNYAPIGIALVSATGKWLKVNKAMSRILGYSVAEFRSMHFQSMLFQNDLGTALVKINDVLAGRVHSCQLEHRYVHKSGKTVWASWSVSAASESSTEQSHLIFQIQDITDRKLAEEKLQHEATHDALTGLPNRAHFLNRLEEALEKSRRDPKYKVSVLFIDLDRFKYVNDSLGHFIGDRLLIAIADRLKGSMRPPDMVARLGGDEFIVLVEGRYYMEKVTRVADRIQENLSAPFIVQDHEIYSSASIGILHATEQHRTSEDMMRDADTAMYHAKRSGKARHETFNEAMRTAVRETLLLETDLRRAIQNEELEVFYQPIFLLDDDTITGVEALARWEHPIHGIVSPAKFVPLAEEIGWIDQLGEQILRRACREMAATFSAAGPQRQLKLSVNLSCKQFARPDVVTRINSILDETGFSPLYLKLEITESIVLEYQERVIEMLHKLRDLGIELDIDDFGTGYSNLGYLCRLPLSTLKIDRSFVTPINEEGANSEIVRTIIAMARNLGLSVVAEGIETEAQLHALKMLGCERGQGYYFAKPMSRHEIHRFLVERVDLPLPPHLDDIPVLSTLQ